MRSAPTPLAAAAVLAALLAPPPALAQAPVTDSRALEARLTRLERTLSSSSLVQMHETLQGLAREVRELRGEIEVQRHEIEQLKQRQRDLYVDMDKRIQSLESAAPAATAAARPPPTQAPGAPPSPQTRSPGLAATAPPGAPAPGPGTGASAASDGTSAAATPGDTSASPDPAAEQQAYREAFELLKNGQFTQASSALGRFLEEYPNGRFADNAQYWLGESYYVSREFDPALKAFEQLLADYPDSPKRSHAMLKIGFIHDEAGRREQARQTLEELVRLYPQSTAASLASKRLKRLQ